MRVYYVRKGYERELALHTLMYHISSTNVKTLKDNGFFEGDARVNATPLEFFSLSYVKAEFAKTLIESLQREEREVFRNQSRISVIKGRLLELGLTEKHLRFLSVNKAGKIYLKQDAVECTKHCLRNFFGEIPILRQEELRRAIIQRI